MDDVVIVGGSFAGLTAAMHLVRARRRVTILDTDLPRNRYAEGAHNVLGFDGAPPAAIRAAGLANVLAYPTARHVVAEAVGIGGVADDFVIRTLDGGLFPARRLILSYGVADQFPAIPGFAECWGKTVVHCPYCHGYEIADRPLGLLYSSPASLHVTALLRDWTDNLTLFSNGLDLPDGEVARLEASGVAVLEGGVAEIVHSGGQMTGVRMADGREIALGGMFAHPKVKPSARLHEDIGIVTEESVLGPYIRVNDEFETSVRGIFAAGDLAGPRHSVNGAIQGGSLAAVGAHRSLLGFT
ncbi:MAG: NAD(P)/FAD-dependent oxidoreductase [Hyphomicrobiales bacterium]|nr:MAG: NAD(P)/FAD-dependent oxidoreductase [Hyphomicrobiales bacterium]